MFKRFIASLICVTFSFTNLQYVHAQDFSINQLPVPGTMVGESTPFAPLALKGLIVNPQKPLEFQFIVDTGKGPQDTASVKDQANQLVKYFLAGLTIPEGDLWVNLSPYEKNRMVPEALGQTDLGRDLLAQDYILKQLTASLIYPEKDLGKEFWSRVYAKAQAQFGTTNVPVNTFNKVWILPDQAQVFENVNAAYVTKSTLKVMLDEDYLAKQKHQATKASGISSQIVREIVIPEITKEVNTGKNFAPLRQIYQALILAKWYKETIQNGLLDALYTNKNKVDGVNLNDPTVKEQIYNRYLQAYKKGAFNYIKDDPTPDGQVMPRKYFSGGISKLEPGHVATDGPISAVNGDGAMISLTVALATAGAAIVGGLAVKSKIQKANQRKIEEARRLAREEVLNREMAEHPDIVKRLEKEIPGGESYDKSEKVRIFFPIALRLLSSGSDFEIQYIPGERNLIRGPVVPDDWVSAYESNMPEEEGGTAKWTNEPDTVEIISIFDKVRKMIQDKISTEYHQFITKDLINEASGLYKQFGDFRIIEIKPVYEEEEEYVEGDSLVFSEFSPGGKSNYPTGKFKDVLKNVQIKLGPPNQVMFAPTAQKPDAAMFDQMPPLISMEALEEGKEMKPDAAMLNGTELTVLISAGLGSMYLGIKMFNRITETRIIKDYVGQHLPMYSSLPRNYRRVQAFELMRLIHDSPDSYFSLERSEKAYQMFPYLSKRVQILGIKALLANFILADADTGDFTTLESIKDILRLKLITDPLTIKTLQEVIIVMKKTFLEAMDDPRMAPRATRALLIIKSMDSAMSQPQKDAAMNQKADEKAKLLEEAERNIKVHPEEGSPYYSQYNKLSDFLYALNDPRGYFYYSSTKINGVWKMVKHSRKPMNLTVNEIAKQMEQVETDAKKHENSASFYLTQYNRLSDMLHALDDPRGSSRYEYEKIGEHYEPQLNDHMGGMLDEFGYVKRSREYIASQTSQKSPDAAMNVINKTKVAFWQRTGNIDKISTLLENAEKKKDYLTYNIASNVLDRMGDSRGEFVYEFHPETGYWSDLGGYTHEPTGKWNRIYEHWEKVKRSDAAMITNTDRRTFLKTLSLIGLGLSLRGFKAVGQAREPMPILPMKEKVDRLMGTLKGSRERFFEGTAKRLGSIKNFLDMQKYGQDISRLEDAFSSNDVDKLSAMGPEVVPFLLGYLKSQDRTLRAYSAFALKGIADSRALDELRRVGDTDPEWLIRSICIDAVMASMKPDDVVSYGFSILQSNAPYLLKIFTLNSMKNYGKETAAKAFISKLKEDDDDMWCFAVTELGLMAKDLEQMPEFQLNLKPESFPALFEASKSSDPRTRVGAIVAFDNALMLDYFNHKGNQEDLAAFKVMLQSKNEFIRILCLATIANYFSKPVADEILKSLLNDPDLQIRALASELLRLKDQAMSVPTAQKSDAAMKARTGIALAALSITGVGSFMAYKTDYFQLRSPFIDVAPEYAQHEYYYPRGFQAEDGSIALLPKRIVVEDINGKLENGGWALEMAHPSLWPSSSSFEPFSGEFNFNLVNKLSSTQKIETVLFVAYGESGDVLKSWQQTPVDRFASIEAKQSIDLTLPVSNYEAVKQISVTVITEDQSAYVFTIVGVDKLFERDILGKGDHAQKARDLGGVDLNQINVLRNGKTVNVQFDPAQLSALEQGGFKGFTPVIINMTRISSPFQLLGISTPKQDLQLAKA